MSEIETINQYYQASEGYIWLPINFNPAGLPEKLYYSGKDIFLKDEFHVTLINTNQFSDIEGALIIEEFKNYTRYFDIELLELKDEYLQVVKDDKVSLIQMCALSALDDFVRHLNQSLNILVPEVPTHVTLYVSKDSRGIPINSQQEIRRYTKTVPSPYAIH